MQVALLLSFNLIVHGPLLRSSNIDRLVLSFRFPAINHNNNAGASSFAIVDEVDSMTTFSHILGQDSSFLVQDRVLVCEN